MRERKNVVRRMLKQMRASLRERAIISGRRERQPRGHYHSPYPDYEYVSRRAAALFSKDVDVGPSLNLRSEEQLALLKDLAGFYAGFDWSEEPGGRRYHVPNTWFDEGDAIALYSLLRRFRPRHVIEVGSGYSSALMLDTNERYLDRSTRFTFVEPSPQRLLALLRPADREQALIVQKPVQDLPLSVFTELEADDFLFIDSSHVSKIGSDVNYLVFDVLPRLRAGVVVHFHDITWPFEYPREWVMKGRVWNEAYLVRAFLQYNEVFEILLFNSYVGYKFASVLEASMPRYLRNPGGSLWLRKR